MRLCGGYFQSRLFVVCWLPVRRRSRNAAEQGISAHMRENLGHRVLVVMNAGMAAMILGGAFQHWELRHICAICVLMGLVAGFAGGLGWRGTSDHSPRDFGEWLWRLRWCPGRDSICMNQQG